MISIISLVREPAVLVPSFDHFMMAFSICWYNNNESMYKYIKKNKTRQINLTGLLEKGYMRTLLKSDVEINISKNPKKSFLGMSKNKKS